jgi:hypothetical protein
MKQQLTAILTLLTIGILGTPAAQAKSIALPVKPNQPDGGLQFDVKRAIDKNPKQYRFTVDIRATDATAIPDGYTAALAWGAPSGRSIPCTRQNDGHVTCKFTVPIKAIQNPRLVFFYTAPGFSIVRGERVPEMYVDMRYFSLKTAVSK